MTEKFEPGDVVRLKSGGPAMTVSHHGTADNADDVMCEWFVGSARSQKVFTAATLEKTTPGVVSSGIRRG